MHLDVARSRSAKKTLVRAPSRQSNTRLPDHILDELDAIAAEMSRASEWEPVTRSDVIRLAVREFLDRRRAAKK